jgi:DNA-binding transcriptional LysR family regulator
LDLQRNGPDQIDGFLLRVFVTVMEERSASRAAVRLNVPQSTVSAALARLRIAIGDKLLVRGRKEMVPTEHAIEIFETVQSLIGQFEAICAGDLGSIARKPSRSLSIAAFDYIAPDLIPAAVSEIMAAIPSATIQVHNLSVDRDYEEALEGGEFDLVIGNWGEPAGHLKRRSLFSDDIVCLVSADHPLAESGITREQYLAADHIGLIPHRVDRLGVIDGHLAKLGVRRQLRVILPSFSGIIELLVRTDGIVTTCRSLAKGHAKGLPLRVLPPPFAFPKMNFYLLWHERSHQSLTNRLLRNAISKGIKRRLAELTDNPD